MQILWEDFGSNQLSLHVQGALAIPICTDFSAGDLTFAIVSIFKLVRDLLRRSEDALWQAVPTRSGPRAPPRHKAAFKFPRVSSIEVVGLIEETPRTRS